MLAIGISVLQWPVSTRQGVNYVVQAQRLPLYQKAMGLWYRDLEMRRLVRGIVQGSRTPEETFDRLWQWMQTSLHAGVPAGLPVVDDHVWHIVIRGYGTSDQLADVMALLCTDAGLPAKWFFVPSPRGGAPYLPLVFVRLQGAWRVCDPAHHVVMRTAQGRWYSVEDISRTPELVEQLAPGLMWNGQPYSAFFRDVAGRVDFTKVSRNEIQAPLPRLREAVGRLWQNMGRRETP